MAVRGVIFDHRSRETESESVSKSTAPKIRMLQTQRRFCGQSLWIIRKKRKNWNVRIFDGVKEALKDFFRAAILLMKNIWLTMNNLISVSAEFVNKILLQIGFAFYTSFCCVFERFLDTENSQASIFWTREDISPCIEPYNGSAARRERWCEGWGRDWKGPKEWDGRCRW